MEKETAIKVLKELHDKSLFAERTALETLIPELKESEDERIKKDIIDFVRHSVNRIPAQKFNKYIAWLEKQGEKIPDKIVEKARTEKQKVLLTETDGNASIDWDCRSLDDVKTLLKCGLEFIRTIEANKQTLTDSRFGGCSFRVPTRYDKGIKQGEQKPAKVIDKYEGLTDFERTLADICIGWIGEEIGWKEYIKDNANVLFKIAVEKFNSVQDVPFELKSVWSEEDERIFDALITSLNNEVFARRLKTLKGIGVSSVINWLKSIKHS